MSRRDGGPAFPANTLNVPFADADSPKYAGMTLRDYFAGQALIGLLASQYTDATNAGKAPAISYQFADQMLKERDK